MFLNTSTARQAFKDFLGSANHLIITAMVGLDAIERTVVKEVPKDLHAAWSPRDPVTSARRSRRLLLDMALVRSVDALDIYIRHAVRKPTLIQAPAAQQALDQAQNSIYGKFRALNSHYRKMDQIAASLVGLMITWRNRAAHAESDCETDSEYLKTIRENGQVIADRFRGLDTTTLLAGYDASRAPYFKEVTSFINATHHYVEDLENRLYAQLDREAFLKELIWKAISPDVIDRPDRTAFRKKRIQSIWGRSSNERRGYVERFLQHHGLAREKIAKERETPFLKFDDDLIRQVAEMTPTLLYKWIEPAQQEGGSST
jgi:hypothetical protein